MHQSIEDAALLTTVLITLLTLESRFIEATPAVISHSSSFSNVRNDLVTCHSELNWYSSRTGEPLKTIDCHGALDLFSRSEVSPHGSTRFQFEYFHGRDTGRLRTTPRPYIERGCVFTIFLRKRAHRDPEVARGDPPPRQGNTDSASMEDVAFAGGQVFDKCLFRGPPGPGNVRQSGWTVCWILGQA